MTTCDNCGHPEHEDGTKSVSQGTCDACQACDRERAEDAARMDAADARGLDLYR